MTLIVAFSDLHCRHDFVGEILDAARNADLVIGAGDFGHMRKRTEETLGWLAPLADKAIYVPGNAESVEETRAATTARVLHGEATEMAGLKIFGLGYAVPITPFGSWSCDLSEGEAAKLLAAMDEADILVTHSPPKGVADKTSSGASVGSEAIRAAIERVQPRLALCGHIHDSWGVRGRIGATEVVNLGPRPVIFEL